MSENNTEINQFYQKKNEEEELYPKDRNTKIHRLEAKLKSRTILSFILASFIIILLICLSIKEIKSNSEIPLGNKNTPDEEKLKQYEVKHKEIEVKLEEYKCKANELTEQVDSLSKEKAECEEKLKLLSTPKLPLNIIGTKDRHKETENKNLRNKISNSNFKIGIYSISSLLHDENSLKELMGKFLGGLEGISELKFSMVDSPKKFSSFDLGLILVQTGGAEIEFIKNIFPVFEGPYYLLTYGSSNSLAASLEILTFLRQKNKKGEILHGNDEYICNRIIELIDISRKAVSKETIRLGVLAKPSDWLIGSNVDYKKIKEIFNIELIDISQEEVFDEIKKHKTEAYDKKIIKTDFNSTEMDKAYQIYKAFDAIKTRYKLSGVTIRCFDIIKEFKMSACLALAILNRDSIIATCEGDIPAMITAYEIFRVLNLHAFQANPQLIEPSRNYVEFAHCTLPLDMAQCVTCDTHFESQIGVGIHGDMKTGKITVIKISPELNEFYVENGELVENQYRQDRCRTQIAVKLNGDVSYFLKSSLGNHHQIIYGHYKKELKDYFESLGLRQVI